MADTVYEWGMTSLVAGDIDWDADDIKVALVDSADYTIDAVNDQFLSDIPSGAIVSTSAVLTGKAVTAGVATADDAVFTSVTGDVAEALVVYQSTGVDSTSRLITYVDSAAGLPVTPSGGNITVAWTGGVVFYLSGLQGSLIIVVADETERLALTSSDGDLVWQTDTNELYVYIDGATPTWGLIYPAAASGSLNQLRFDYTGSAQTWVVPDSVTSIAVTAVGADGGANSGGIGNASGAKVEAIISTTPAETLNIYVGGKGTDSPGNSTAAGGYNGGGDGVNGGGGGGGATDIRQNGTALSDRVLVAGGAGGTGGNDSITVGGRGGAPTGETGFSGYPSNAGCGVAGGGATTSAGGAGGTGGGTGSAGASGSLGTGGAGGASADGNARGGAGGGGGYYGGGGGEGGQTAGDSGGGGGGGSSLVPTNGESDARSGIGRTNGYLIISWVE